MTDRLQNAFMQSPLFAGEQTGCETRVFSDLESLSEYADAQESVGIMVTGLADVWCQATDGTKTLLNTIRKGDCFGIAYLAGKSAMQTSVIARGQCEAAFIKKDRFMDMLSSNTAMTRRYLSMCNRKIQFLLGRIMLLTAQTSRTKLISYLLLNQDEQGFVALNGTKEDLSNRLSVSRATVYRELNYLQNQQLISLEKRGVSLLKPEALRTLLYEESNHQEGESS